jgi:predicted regulator of Ras-like GTPase activity (Roadblock/LC7/MglB family)
MQLNEIIEELVEKTPGARAAILADWEGEAVVAYTSGEQTDYEIKFVGAHHGILLSRAKEMIDRLSLGSPKLISFKHDEFNIITAPVNNDYYIVLTLGPDSIVGQANMTLKRAVSEVEKDIG